MCRYTAKRPGVAAPGRFCSIFGRGGLFLRLVAIVIPVQPFAGIVGNNACRNRDQKRYQILQSTSPPFRAWYRRRQREYYMIKILLSKDKYLYDIHSLVKSFFQEESIESTVIPDGDAKKHINLNENTIIKRHTSPDGTDITIYQSINNEITISIQLPVMTDNLPRESGAEGGEEGAAREDERPNRSTDGSDLSAVTEKNAVKQALYRALSDMTGRTLPWGALTGIRPTKIATQMLAVGKDDNTIKNYLNTVHFVSDEKADLSIEIAHREKDILSRYDYQSGYTLYVGIPFCPTRCSYCSFAAYPLRIPEMQMDNRPSGVRHVEYLKSRYATRVDAYMDALEKELAATADFMRGVRLDTVYIGGGTPTALPHLQLRRLLKILRDRFDLRNVREYTVEAGRPDSILDTLGKLATLREFDVDRICVNPQTFSQKTLDAIGRGHTVEQTIEAFHLARDAGFDNINMDIILGLPGETKEDVAHTMEEIKKLAPDDLTVHSLALKRGSAMQEKQAADAERKRTAPNAKDAFSPAREEDVSAPDYAEMARIADEGAREMGLHPYYLYRQKNMTGNMENTGYAKRGKEGLSNILGMEEVHSVVACGCGAISKRVFHVPKGDESFGKITRIGNVKELDQYISRVDEMIERKVTLFHM